MSVTFCNFLNTGIDSTEWTVIAWHLATGTTALIWDSANTADVSLVVLGLIGSSVPTPGRDGVPVLYSNFHSAGLQQSCYNFNREVCFVVLTRFLVEIDHGVSLRARPQNLHCKISNQLTQFLKCKEWNQNHRCPVLPLDACRQTLIMSEVSVSTTVPKYPALHFTSSPRTRIS